MSDTWMLGAVGDVFLNRPKPDEAFQHVAPLLNDVNVLFGNCEGVFTDQPRSVPTASGFRLISEASNAAPLGPAGFQVMSCANNHAVDAGHDGLIDTLTVLRQQGILVAGAGEDLSAARAPATLDHGGLRIAFLAYTSVYPSGYEARDRSAGVAAMRVHAHYFVHPDAFGRVEPGADPQIRTFPFPEDMRAFRESVLAAKEVSDVVIVSFHWGKSTRPAFLMDYERTFGHAAIDAGCDVVLGHHHHFLRAIEIYRNKPIFYGLGHFAFDMPGLEDALSPDQLARLHQTGEYAIYPREGYPLLPFHPDARMTMIGVCVFDGKRVVDVGYIPCLIDADNNPVPLEPDSEAGRRVIAYMNEITDKAGLCTRYTEPGPVIGGFQSIQAT